MTPIHLKVGRSLLLTTYIHVKLDLFKYVYQVYPLSPLPSPLSPLPSPLSPLPSGLFLLYLSPTDFDGCVFADDPFWDITWANTPIGETDIQRCPSGEGTYVHTSIIIFKPPFQKDLPICPSWKMLLGVFGSSSILQYCRSSRGSELGSNFHNLQIAFLM